LIETPLDFHGVLPSGVSDLVFPEFFVIAILRFFVAHLTKGVPLWHGKVRPPPLSAIQKKLLVFLTKRRDSPQHLVRRIRIILLASEKQNAEQIAPQVGLCVKTVRTWRHRWNDQAEQLTVIEAKGDEKALHDFIVDVVLADEPYNGERGKYTPEQITQLYAIACESPEDSDRPISHWSCRELSEEMVKRGIVKHIPISTLWDFLKSRRFETSQDGRLDDSKIRRSNLSRAK
jgi:putative transposase